MRRGHPGGIEVAAGERKPVVSEETKPWRLMLVDDHLVVRRGLASLLEDEADFTVVAEAGAAGETVREQARTRPDVVVLDLRLADGSGVEVARRLRQQDPAVRILVLSSYLQEEDVRQVFAAGVAGYLAKDSSSEELVEAIRNVGRGGTVVPPEVSHLLARGSGQAALTERELEILRSIARGRSNKEIGNDLAVSENTVKNHVKSILSKLGARDRTHAVTEGLRRGLIRLEG